MFNVGVFAVGGRAPHWAAMQVWQRVMLRRAKPFTVDETSLSVGIYEDELPVNLLPQRFNYMGQWRVNVESKELAEYYCPYEPFGIVHLTDAKQCLFDASHKSQIFCTRRAGGRLHRFGTARPTSGCNQTPCRARWFKMQVASALV